MRFLDIPKTTTLPTAVAILLLSLWLDGSIAASPSSPMMETPPTPSTSASSPSARRPLLLIYAGMGRSGTTSLKLALRRIGLNPVHGGDVCRGATGSHAEMSRALIEGDVERALNVTAEMGYDVTLEAHGIFWRDIVSLEKDAGVIFVSRDFEGWYESMARLWIATSPAFRYPLKALPLFHATTEFSMGLTAQLLQLSLTEAEKIVRDPYSVRSRNAYRTAHDRFTRDMEEFISQNPDRSFVFSKEDGYGALCSFLHSRGVDVECPHIEEPFPHAYSRRDLKVQYVALLTIEAVLYSIPLICLLLVAKRRQFKMGGPKEKKT